MRLCIGPFSMQSADHHDMRIALHCSVSVRAQSVDRRAFVESFMRDQVVATQQDLIRFLLPCVRDAVQRECDRAASALLSDAGREALQDRIRTSLDATVFEAGMVLSPPFRLEVESPSLQAERQQQAERARTAERAAVQLEHVRHASEVLLQFETLQKNSPLAHGGQLLEQIAPADRSSILLATLAARAAATPPSTIVAVAGNSLLLIEADRPAPIVIILPDSLGPLRSVRPASFQGEGRLLVGARAGVWLVDPADPLNAAAYHDQSLRSTLGFNSALVSQDGCLYATHADGGLVRWEIGKGDAPAVIKRPTQEGAGARHLRLLDDGCIAFVSDNKLKIVRQETETIEGNSPRPIVALLADEQGLLIVRENGTVERLDRAAKQLHTVATFAGGVYGAALLPWVGTARLLLARDSGVIECVGLEDSVVHRYQSAYGGATRALAAGQSSIVAVTNDRQRLIAWNPGDGRVPQLDLNISSLVHHRVADVVMLAGAGLTV